MSLPVLHASSPVRYSEPSRHAPTRRGERLYSVVEDCLVVEAVEDFASRRIHVEVHLERSRRAAKRLCRKFGNIGRNFWVAKRHIQFSRTTNCLRTQLSRCCER